MSVSIYGIKNCDTMKKAFTWLADHGIAYDFHDYRAEGIDPDTVRAWAREIGWEKLLNRSSTTFRGLPDVDKADLGEVSAITLMAANPTLIKRPVLVADGKVTNGFKPETYAAIFSR